MIAHAKSDIRLLDLSCEISQVILMIDTEPLNQVTLENICVFSQHDIKPVVMLYTTGTN